jgi:hypothetical protein
MDYTDEPGGKDYGQDNNLHPNLHDYDELISIYAHLNSTDVGNGDSGSNR